MSKEKVVLGSHVAKAWTTTAGLTAVVIMCRGRHHCGYVGLPESHVLHGLHYSEESQYIRDITEEEPVGQRGPISLLCMGDKKTSPEIAYDVHGSLTYAGKLDFPEIDPSLWYFGYDCAHCDDGVSPQYVEWAKENLPENIRDFETTEGFKDLDFCIAQCESLAKQIVDKLIFPALEDKSNEQ